MKRMLFGEPMTQGVIRVLCDSRKRNFPADKLRATYERTDELLQTKQVKEVIDKAIREEIDE
jgi:hypothetical protein